ncbi:MAG: hypothetical protein CMD33_08250 [Flavobacteriales bacterium]|nr:hypothetical protein [Flavobacteriales bacterium]
MTSDVIPICDRPTFVAWLREHADSDLGAQGPTHTHDAIPYDVDDLHFLYTLIRDTCAISFLEYGSGWSTLACSRAISENKASFGDAYTDEHPNRFELLTVDASQHWQTVALQRLPREYSSVVSTCLAPAKLIDYSGQVASVFDGVPAFTPDVIYVDAPDPRQVTGQVLGFDAASLNEIPIAADLLFREFSLWPGTVIVFDGRTSNARFLHKNFRRNWQWLHDPYGDRTIFRLDEPPLGWKNLSHTHFRARAARELRVFN